MLHGQVLINGEVIDDGAVAQALERQRQLGGTLGDNLAILGFVPPELADQILLSPPPAPRNLGESGLSEQLVLNLLLKTMYITDLQTASTLANQIKLSQPIVSGVLEAARKQGLIEALGTDKQISLAELRFALSGKGKEWAHDAFEQSRYVGAAPVPLKVYQVQNMRQRIANERVDRETLRAGLAHLVLPEEFIDRLGPAINSGRSLLLYGPPGNGKTAIAFALGKALRQFIYVPHCIEVDGHIIQIYDPVVHSEVREFGSAPTDSKASSLLYSYEHDPRWVRCRRPVVITGGELSLEMLDLSFNPQSRYYEAPLQLKATGGIFVVDDFGRQIVKPEDLLNRWIIPLEKRVDYLTLFTGKKFPVPFDELVILSTNDEPSDMLDGAMMRRIPYKMAISDPTREDYEQIMKRACQLHGMTLPKEIIPFLFDEFYGKAGFLPARSHPIFIVEQVVAEARFAGKKPTISLTQVINALDNLYTGIRPKSYRSGSGRSGNRVAAA